MSNLFLIFDIVIVLGLLGIAMASFTRRGFYNPVNRSFAFFSVLVAFWILANNISNDVSVAKDMALIANCFVLSSAFGVAILMMKFIVRLVEVKRLEAIVKFAMPLLWSICLICFTPLIVAGVYVQNDIYAISFGPLIALYAAGLAFAIFVLTYGIVHGLKYSRGTKRRQLMVVGVGLTISMPLVVLLSFIAPLLTGEFYITRFGITPLIILVICLYYGVVRYSLFDIRRSVVRIGTYALSLLTLSMVYYVSAYFISISLIDDTTVAPTLISPLSILLALILVFIFQPIKKFFNKVTNKFFYKDDYVSDDFFARLNKVMTITTSLRDLLERISSEIGSTLKSEQVFFYVKTSDNHYISAGTSKHRNLPKSDAIELGECKNKNEGLIVATLLEANDPIRRLMLSHKVELVLPLHQNGQIIGFLCLGDHKTSGYTIRDMKVLSTISDEIVIAIQNALSVQEVKDLNENLQHRIEMATKELRASNAQLQRLDKAKDEFVSMASHQLRTPLTSVKGYISMVLDGDVGEVNDQMRPMLEEAFTSSERMVHLINDFLSMSRIQTGKFIIEKTSSDLSQVVKQEIDSLQPSAIAHNLRFNYDKPADFPSIDIDEGKIRQVIMNFSDNAIYYSKHNSEIDIILTHDKDSITFAVKDSGIGVPASEQANLFSKFYRASNAKTQRPDGTGVGLYLAKRIISAHGGKIVFESVEGEGSTFGFTLPIKQG